MKPCHHHHQHKLIINKVPSKIWKLFDSVVWLVIFIFFSFWISAFSAFWNFFIDPLSVFVPPLRVISKCLCAATHFPRDCAINMLAGKDVLQYFFPDLPNEESDDGESQSTPQDPEIDRKNDELAPAETPLRARSLERTPDDSPRAKIQERSKSAGEEPSEAPNPPEGGPSVEGASPVQNPIFPDEVSAIFPQRGIVRRQLVVEPSPPRASRDRAARSLSAERGQIPEEESQQRARSVDVESPRDAPL